MDRVGEKFGGYSLVERLGEGAVATVYRARRGEGGKTDVALKIIAADVAADPDARRRLARDVAAASALQNPHIAPPHEVVHEGGRMAVVGELAAGTSLADRLEAGPLELRAALALCAQLLEALGHAHARGHAHRDVKPSNIWITRAGALQLTDFGLAGLAAMTPLARAGFGVAAPHYAAPEQIQGGLDVGPPADLYAAGIILHEMLAGVPPFDAPADQRFAVLQDHIRRPPPHLRASCPEVPLAVEAAVLRALRKDALERFGSAAEFAAAIQRRAPGAGDSRRPG